MDVWESVVTTVKKDVKEILVTKVQLGLLVILDLWVKLEYKV